MIKFTWFIAFALSHITNALSLLEALPNYKQFPSQHRLAFSGGDGITVSWNTFEALKDPTVHYGLFCDNLNQTTTSNVSITYNTSTTWNNHVKLRELIPDTKYYYKVSNDNNVYSFKTSKPAGKDDEFSFGVVIDMGVMGSLGLSDWVGKGAANPLDKWEQNTIDSLRELKDEYEFLIHPGDIAYADSWLVEESENYLPNTSLSDGYQVYEKILNTFYNELQPITAWKPYMIAAGNHEADCIETSFVDKENGVNYTNEICLPGQTNFTGIKNHFRMPGDESNGLGNFWYSFDYGLAHFVIYDTETDFGNGIKGPEDVGGRNGPEGSYENQQIDFLAEDLASVNRSKTPWVLAFGHRPYYAGANKSDLCSTCQQAFEEILYKGGVDLVMNGHVHNYVRMDPIYNNTVDSNLLQDPSYPWYILNGIAGHYDGISKLAYPLPEYVRYAQDTEYGWSKLTIHNSTHLTHEFIISRNNTVLDSATLFKSRTQIS